MFALRVLEKHTLIQEQGWYLPFFLCLQLSVHAKTGDRKSRKPGRKEVSRSLWQEQENRQ